jgi:flagellar biogenesis protein FliO
MDLAEQLSMVALVLLMLGGILWALRSRGLVSFRGSARARGLKQRLQVMERVPLTASHSLHLVRIADRVLLIGVAPSGCTLLDSSKEDGFPAVYE